MSRPSDGMKPPTARAAHATGQSGRTLRTVIAVILGVVVALAVAVTLFVFVGLPAIGCRKAASGAPAGTIGQYCFAPFASPGQIVGIVAGPDGNLWFTEGARIGRITPQGAIAVFALPAGQDAPGPIVAGPDGNLWFVEQQAVALGRITPRGAVTEFRLPAGDTVPVSLTVGPDGNLWYARSTFSGAGGPPGSGPGVIGRMTPGGTATEFPIPSATSNGPSIEPLDIVAGPDGALWFVTGIPYGAFAGVTGIIMRVTTDGKMSTVYAPDPRSLVQANAIALGPDHNLWFTEASGGAPGGSPGMGTIGRLTPGGTVTFFPQSVSPGAIVAGPDGNLWFATGGGQIGRITPAGRSILFPLPDPQAEPSALAAGPDGGIWFAESYPDIDPINGLIWGSKFGRVTT